MMTEQSAGNTLVEMTKAATKKKSKMTLELEMETLAELKAAVLVFGAKSYSSLVHQQVVAKIREAKQMVSKEEWEKLCGEQLVEISARSEQKSLEREKSIKLKGNEAVGEEVIKDFDVKKHRPKVAGKKSGGKITTSDGKTHRFIEEDDGGFNSEE